MVFTHLIKWNNPLLLLTLLTLTTSSPLHQNIQPPSTRTRQEATTPEDYVYENPYQIFSDDPSEYSNEYSSDQTEYPTNDLSNRGDPTEYSMEFRDKREQIGRMTAVYLPSTVDDYDLQGTEGTSTTEMSGGYQDKRDAVEADGALGEEEDEDEADSRDRRDLLRDQRKPHLSQNNRCTKLNGLMKCDRREYNSGSLNDHDLNTYVSDKSRSENKMKLKENSTMGNKDWKSFDTKQELFKYIEDFVLKPVLNPNVTTTTEIWKKNRIVKSPNMYSFEPIEKVEKAYANDMGNSWSTFQDWMKKQLNQPESKLVSQTKVFKNSTIVKSVQNSKEPSKKNGRPQMESFHKGTQSPFQAKPFVIFNTSSQTVNSYKLNPSKSKYIVKQKDSSQKLLDGISTIETSKEGYDPNKHASSSEDFSGDVKQFQKFYSVNKIRNEPEAEKTPDLSQHIKGKFITVSTKENGILDPHKHALPGKSLSNDMHFQNPYSKDKGSLKALGSTKKGLEVVKTLNLLPGIKDKLPVREDETNLFESSLIKNKNTQAVVDNNYFLLPYQDKSPSEKHRLKDEDNGYNSKVTDMKEKLIVPHSNDDESLLIGENPTKVPPVITIPTRSINSFAKISKSYLEPIEVSPNKKSPKIEASMERGYENELDMVIKLPKNALKEMEDSIRNKNKVIMKLDFEKSDSKSDEDENNIESAPEPNLQFTEMETNVPKSKSNRHSKSDASDMSPEDIPKPARGKERADILKFTKKVKDCIQNSVNKRKDLDARKKTLLYNIIMQKFLKLLNRNIELLSKNQ